MFFLKTLFKTTAFFICLMILGCAGHGPKSLQYDPGKNFFSDQHLLKIKIFKFDETKKDYVLFSAPSILSTKNYPFSLTVGSDVSKNWLTIKSIITKNPDTKKSGNIAFIIKIDSKENSTYFGEMYELENLEDRKEFTDIFGKEKEFKFEFEIELIKSPVKNDDCTPCNM